MRKYLLLIFFFVVLAFSVRAVCCDKGCYPDANCCGADGLGYFGCEATGNVFSCPQNDAVEGKLLGECLNCLCYDAYTCWWDADAANFCDPGEVCSRENDGGGLPKNSVCVNQGCQRCEDCCGGCGVNDDGCKREYCHDCGSGECYYDPQPFFAPDCYSCNDARTDRCSDFNDDPNACNGEIASCILGTYCYWRNNRGDCQQCGADTECEDYADINTCELDHCPSTGECLWNSKNSKCFTIPPGFCNNNNKAERSEACDGTDLNGKGCVDFGFEGGTLGCSGCQYDPSDCKNHRCNNDGDVDGGEMCDCGGGKICTSEQLNGYDCNDFDDFNGGVLSCYSEGCSFDTRACSICDQDGARELGESCDCGEGSCNQEQLNYKKCTDFGFSGGTLGCNQNCEYDSDNCVTYSCDNDGTKDSTEMCDGSDFGGKSCSYFDYFVGGNLECTDECEFDTRGCEIADADDNSNVCELKNEGKQGVCSKMGDRWCWSPSAKSNSGECCGDDRDVIDKWIDADGNSCCQDSSGNYVFQTDADYSSCFCNLKGDPVYGGGGNAGVCDSKDETFCWSSSSAKCCGDDADERWSYKSSYSLDNVLVKETCYNAVWKKRSQLVGIIYYDLSADLV